MRRFKKLLSMMLAVVLVVGAVNLPAKEVKAAESVTLGCQAAHVRITSTHNLEDYLIYLNGITAAQVSALSSKTISQILIDGKAVSNYGIGQDGTNVYMTIAPSTLEAGKTTMASLGAHIITIPQGATVGGTYEVAADLTFYTNGQTAPTVVDIQKLAFSIVPDATPLSRLRLSSTSYANPASDVVFTAGTTDAKITFTRGDQVIDLTTIKWSPWGLYLHTGGTDGYDTVFPGISASQAGDTIRLTGIWKDAKGGFYDFGDVTYECNGTNWKEYITSENKVTFGFESYGATTLRLKDLSGLIIKPTGADYKFAPANMDSIATYTQGSTVATMEAESGKLPWSKWELYLHATEKFTGITEVKTGDIVTINGVWTYNNVHYDFGYSQYEYNGTRWVMKSDNAVTFGIESAGANTFRLNDATGQIKEPESGNKTFKAINPDSKVTYTLADGTIKELTSVNWSPWGLYLHTGGTSGTDTVFSGVSSSGAGDTMVIQGVWAYQNQYYDFGKAEYSCDGTNWVEGIQINATPVTFTIANATRSDVLLLSSTDITLESAGADVPFEAYDENSIFQFNGEDLSIAPWSAWGYMHLTISRLKGGDLAAGDSIRLGGIWKFSKDNKYYDFGDVTYKWDGTSWAEVGIPITLTEVSAGWRSGETMNDWMFYMTPSFTISETESWRKLGETTLKIKDGTTESSATVPILVFKDNTNLGFEIDGADLSQTPTNGATVTFPAGIRITYNDVMYETTEDFVWQYNGSSWVKYVKPDYYTPTLFAGSNTEVNGVYLTNADDMPYDENWSLNYTAKDSTSGVWVNGSRTEVFLKKILADRWYVCLVDKGITATRGTTVAVKGTFVNGENEIEFTETTYIYDGTKWCAGSELDMDFAITGIGNSTYEAGLGWKLRFNTDSIVYGEDFATELGTYTIQVNGADTTVRVFTAEGNNLGILVEGLEQYPQGTTVKVQSGTIGDYTLTNTYEIIYDAGQWKLAHETHDVTLSFSHKMNGTNNLVYRYTEDLTGLLSKGQTFKASYADSGIYVNGTKMNDAGIFWWTETDVNTGKVSSYFVIDHGSIATNRGDIVTIKGTFNLGDTYLSFPEVSARFVSDSNWVSSCNYESVYQLFVTDITLGTWQESFNRWLFTAATSMPIEHNSAEFTTAFNPLELIVTIIDPEGTPTTLYEVPAYNADNPTKTAADHLGFFITTAQGLPQDPTGWSITIEPSVLQTTENTYKIMSAYTYTFQNGMWGVVSEREKPASGVFADANGDGTFNAADYVAALKEKQGVFTQDGKKYLCAPDALIAGKTKLQDSDVIRIREELLDRGSSPETYVPVYLVDEEMELAGYQGPREISQDRRFDANGNLRTDYTKTSFLTDQYFQWYKDAGFNTLVAEGDAPFNSESENGLKSAPGYWTNLVNYMNMAAKYDLDVYVTSSLTNAYLKDLTVSTATNSGSETTFDPDYANMEADLREMLTGEGSSHAGTGLLSFKNFKGVMLADELYERWLPNYLNANQVLAAIDPDIEVTSAALSSNAVGMKDDIGNLITSDYETYATKYASYSMNKNFVYDYYPYQGDATKTWNWGYQYTYDVANAKTGTDWLDKLEASAVRAQANGWTTGVALQSFAMDNHASKKVFRSPENKDDIGFQVYTALAYGMKNFNYFTFWEHKDQSPTGEVHTDAMVVFDENDNPKRTGIYYAVQAVNNEITQFDHVFLDYDWKSTINVGSSSLFSSLTQGSSSRITNKTSTNPAIIGCMYDDQKGLDGFWIVNATTPEEDKSNTVTVTFDNATRAMVYNPAANVYGEVVDLTNGTYTANLGSGEGQFVIPLQ